MTPRLRSTSAILVACAVPLVVYVASLQGTVAYWDTGDLQTVPYILGIPYPTGFPGFVFIGWLWSHAFALGSVAWRMNVLNALACALTVAAVAAFLLECGTGAFVAVGAALADADAPGPWQDAPYVDVHPVSFAVVAWAAVCAVRWERDGDRRDGLLLAAAVTLALAVDNTTVLAMPGIAAIAFARAPRPATALRLAAAAALALAVCYAYLPLRSAAVTAARVDPTLTLGIEPGRPFWDDGHPADLGHFVRIVSGTQFGTHTAVAAMLAPATLDRVGGDFMPVVARDFGGVLPWLALFGAAMLWMRARAVLLGLALLGLVPLLFVFAYTQEAEVTRYFLAAYFAVAIAAGYGAHALTSMLPRAPALAAGGVGLALVLALLADDRAANADLFDQPREHDVADYVARVARVSPPDAIVIASWVYATPLGYAAYVEHALGRRIVVTANPRTYAGRYRDWLRARPIVIVSYDKLQLRGFALHDLGGEEPHVYALR